MEAALNKIEFLYGCLTKPNYKFAYPKMTEEHIERLRKIVGPRNYCVHSNVRPECPSCLEGHKARMILASTDEKVTRIGLLEQELVEWKDKPAKALPRLVVCAILIRNGKVLLERRALLRRGRVGREMGTYREVRLRTERNTEHGDHAGD